MRKGGNAEGTEGAELRGEDRDGAQIGGSELGSALNVPRARPLSAILGVETVELWTIHPAPAWGCIKRTEELRNGSPDSDNERVAIEWLREQVAAATGCAPTAPLLWTWYAAQDMRRKRPDLRSSGWLPSGTKGVLAQLAVPASQVLATQFDMWCHALNGSYIDADEAESEAMDEQYGRQPIPLGECVTSWHRMLDLTFGCEEWWGAFDDRQIQAVAPGFKREWVVSEVEFVSR